ncbi:MULTISPECIES: hypothetical protein [Vibrio]|uniref:hypothetical protein n=1 Tax=Vibrio TaxID=662 RepID=UPI001C9D1020|nr:hypothetical protein [Vibrio parahaemolyticus]MBY7719669.1 hypothetical protein [Vibrio parahaemolyticus]MDF5600782.1 hypothetical protein [Vibrio parahaemolyticus]
MSGMGYIACAEFEDTIKSFGEGDSPEAALLDFVEGGEFDDWCCCQEVEDNTHVEVKVFKAIYADTPEANMEDFEDGWAWVLGDEISAHQVLFLS